MPIHITQKYNRYSGPQSVSSLPEANNVIRELVSHVNRLAEQLNSMSAEIQKGQSTGDTTVIINSGITGSGGSSGGGSGSTVAARARSQSLTGGVANTVTFSTPFSTSFVLSSPRCYNSAGEYVSFSIDSIAAAGLTITPLEDCTFEYIAMEFQ
jgi:hypothetical protein